MPKVFSVDNKIKIIEYGKQSEQVVSLKTIANDICVALRKIVKSA